MFHCMLSLQISLKELNIILVEQSFTYFNPLRLKFLEFPIDILDVDSVFQELCYQVFGSILNCVFSGKIHSVVAVPGPVDVDVEETISSLIQS